MVTNIIITPLSMTGMESLPKSSTDVDIIIVGAGIAGINAAYRVQTELPKYTFSILEARDNAGGTWDLFRYPGVRCDSDLYTFGFQWRPWAQLRAIADGTTILNYIRESAKACGIDRKIQFNHKLLAADWSSEEQKWILSVDADNKTQIFRARFIIVNTGICDYDEALQTTIPGLASFKGSTIHPQFWPQDFDCTGKRVVIIGSGATAISLLPALTGTAAQVTMLQRRPNYVVSIPSVDAYARRIFKYFPDWIAKGWIGSRIIRWRYLTQSFLFYRWCQQNPDDSRKLIANLAKKQLPANIPHDPNFKPDYNPWDERVCWSPSGTFFKALHKGNSDVVTDTIKTVTATGIETQSGKTIDADVIVTATGFKIHFFGGAQISVDGTPFDKHRKFVWKGCMLEGLPNIALAYGYLNNSWTLGTDLTADIFCRLIKYMEKNKMASVVPTVTGTRKMRESPMLSYGSTYVKRAQGSMPSTGDTFPWLPRRNYLIDRWVLTLGRLTAGLKFTGIVEKDKRK